MRESGVLSTRSGAPGVEHPRGGSGGNQAFLRKYSLEKRGLFAP